MQYHGFPEVETRFRCIFLHHSNPFLRLAPFKFEVKHIDPEIALIHDFTSVKETEDIKNLARGKMKSTPYILGGKAEAFSKARTSKVMYMNERLVTEAEVVSIKAEQITKLNLYNEEFASENYQIMNYGIGGKISGHIDSPGVIYENLQEKSMSFFIIYKNFIDSQFFHRQANYV